MTLRAYAEHIGEDEKTVHTWKNAAEVAILTGQNFEALTGKIQHLSLIHDMARKTAEAIRLIGQGSVK
jgi:hypothetical protein